MFRVAPAMMPSAANASQPLSPAGTLTGLGAGVGRSPQQKIGPVDNGPAVGVFVIAVGALGVKLIPMFATQVRCFSPGDTLPEALGFMRKQDFSQVMVRRGDGRLSMVTVEGITKWLADDVGYSGEGEHRFRREAERHSGAKVNSSRSEATLAW